MRRILEFKRLLLLFVLLLATFQLSYAHKVPPTSFGAHYSGSLATGQTVLFTGSGSHDNDEQDDLAETPYWMWDFQYDGTTFNDLSTTLDGQLAQWTYSQAATYTVAVIYVDDDGQAGNVYTFQVTIAPSLKRYYYVKDHLGSIRVTVNEAGGVVSWDDYDPWGMQLEGRSGTTVAENGYKFTEKERDVETGYDYFGARYYDSRIARWMSVDPLAEKYPAWSPFNYCADAPVSNTDPNGKWFWGVVIGGGVELGAQVAFRMNQGKSFSQAWSEVNWGNVTLAAGTGLLSGGLSTLTKSKNLLILGNGVLNAGEGYLQDPQNWDISKGIKDAMIGELARTSGLKGGVVGELGAEGTTLTKRIAKLEPRANRAHHLADKMAEAQGKLDGLKEKYEESIEAAAGGFFSDLVSTAAASEHVGNFTRNGGGGVAPSDYTSVSSKSQWKVD